MLAQVRVLALLAALAAAAFAGWTAQGWRMSSSLQSLRAEHNAERAAQAAAAVNAFRKFRNTERSWQAIADEARNGMEAKNAATQRDLDAARDELGGLHNQLAVYSAVDGGGNVPAPSHAALSARLTALADVFEQCTRRYIDLAAEADRHAADSLMLQQAFPKE